jgi:hypothetical protein
MLAGYWALFVLFPGPDGAFSKATKYPEAIWQNTLINWSTGRRPALKFESMLLGTIKTSDRQAT